MKQFICVVLATLLINVKSNKQNNPTAMEKSSYSVEVIRYDIPEGQWQSFEKAYQAAGDLLAKSKYCRYYAVQKGSEEPNHYIVIIHWTSEEEHLNGFRKSPDFMPFFNLVKPYYTRIQEMKHYKTLNTWTADSTAAR